MARDKVLIFDTNADMRLLISRHLESRLQVEVEGTDSFERLVEKLGNRDFSAVVCGWLDLDKIEALCAAELLADEGYKSKFVIFVDDPSALSTNLKQFCLVIRRPNFSKLVEAVAHSLFKSDDVI